MSTELSDPLQESLALEEDAQEGEDDKKEEKEDIIAQSVGTLPMNNVSRSYLISECATQGLDEYDDEVEEEVSSQCDISRSYVITDRNGNLVHDRIENPAMNMNEQGHKLDDDFDQTVLDMLTSDSAVNIDIERRGETPFDNDSSVTVRESNQIAISQSNATTEVDVDKTYKAENEGVLCLTNLDQSCKEITCSIIEGAIKDSIKVNNDTVNNLLTSSDDIAHEMPGFVGKTVQESNNSKSLVEVCSQVCNDGPLFDPTSGNQTVTNMIDSLDVNNTIQSVDDEIWKGNNYPHTPSVIPAVSVKEVTSSDLLVFDETTNGDPPSLRSIKSIAEMKKKKLMEKPTQKKESVVPVYQYLRKRTGFTAETRYERNRNTKTISEKKSSTISKSNHKITSLHKESTSDLTAKGSAKQNIPSKPSSVKGRKLIATAADQSQKQLHQLQLLNEKEQKNSMKIYQNLKSSQAKWKAEKEKLCADHSKKVEHLNKIIIQLNKNNSSGDGSGDENEVVSTLIENEVVILKKRLQQQDLMIQGFQRDNERLYNELKDSELLQKKMEEERGSERNQSNYALDNLKMVHQLEKEKLETKVQWYERNQLQFEVDAKELRDARERIEELGQCVKKLEEEVNYLKKENTKLSAQTQVEGKNDNVSSIDQQLTNEYSRVGGEIRDSIDVRRDLHVYLENRVRNLERDLEEKDMENSRCVHAIEERYGKLSEEYEDQIKKLEKQLIDLQAHITSEKCSAQKAYEEMEMKHAEEVQELQIIIEEKGKLIMYMNSEMVGKSNGKSDEEKETSLVLKQFESMKKKLQSKESQISELTICILSLQKENKFLNDELQRSNNANMHKSDSPPHTFRKSPIKDSIELKRKEKNDDLEGKYLNVVAETVILKQCIDELQLDCEESRLRLAGAEVQSQNEIRTLTEKYEEEKKQCDETHRKVIEDLKVNFALNHSESKIAELKGKVAGYELTIAHLKSALEESKIDRDRFNELKVSKELMEDKVRQLEQEVITVQSFDTPEISDYKKLAAKISLMEKNHYAREEKLQRIVAKTKQDAAIDVRAVEEKWRKELRQKDAEVQGFQEQLNDIIEVITELQKQGVVITKYDSTAHQPT